ncbi:hypothetical protein GCM10022206_89880 [Streptomyces chiangmaiensis]
MLGLLDECARRARGLVAVAADLDAWHDARLTAACRRVETAVEALLGAVPERALASSRSVPAIIRAPNRLSATCTIRNAPSWPWPLRCGDRLWCRPDIDRAAHGASRAHCSPLV